MYPEDLNDFEDAIQKVMDLHRDQVLTCVKMAMLEFSDLETDRKKYINNVIKRAKEIHYHKGYLEYENT